MRDVFTNQLECFHCLKSKIVTNNKKLLIFDYDYFLTKIDIKLLLNKFQEVILIPTEESVKISSNQIFRNNIFSIQNDLTIVYNPSYENYLENVFELNLKEDSNIQVKSVFDFCETILKKCYVADDINVENPNLQNLTYFGLFPRLIKKSLDWILGSIIYILSQPFWIISSIKIHIESPGPIFFSQERIGINERKIKVYKFRSMKIDAETLGAMFSSKNDDRIFPWGKLMRSSRIDELPQLFNILKGELSLIGPRPERKIFTSQFEKEIPHYGSRHTVKPGISGYAQIKYPYGAGANDARHKLMYDLYYIKNWSFILEMEILFKTILIVLTKRGL